MSAKKKSTPPATKKTADSSKKTVAKKSAPPTPSGSAFLFRITLNYIEPWIWREFVVSPGMKLNHFITLLNDVMGWTNSHLHTLYAGDEEYSCFDHAEEDGCLSAKKFTVGQVWLEPLQTGGWIYDFGDSWEHFLQLKDMAFPAEKKLPYCTGGARACPPEDCGGDPGYENLCAAMQDKKHPERENLIEWLGEVYDPEAFDLDAVNRRLR